MRSQNQNHQQQHQQQPAQESNAAGGWHVVGRYRNADGVIGVEIRVGGTSGTLTYAGLWGTGTAQSRESMASTLRFMLRDRKGVNAEIPFGGVEVQA